MCWYVLRKMIDEKRKQSKGRCITTKQGEEYDEEKKSVK